MHITLAKVARRIRHLPGIERSEWLWNALRPGYHLIAGLGGRGIPFSVGGQTIRVPTEFASSGWDDYEPEEAAIIVDWARQHPGGLFLDVGSAIGVFSAVAMFAGQDIECIAFDSDLASLAAAKRLCRGARGRLRLVHGFVVDQGPGRNLEEAELTEAPEANSAPQFCNFENCNTNIPRNSLDDLFRHYPEVGRAIMLKSDIEGAELFMLRGASGFIARCRPTILLSVHPLHLADYGQTAEDVRRALGELNYSAQLLSVDHEEHWFCAPL